MTGNYSSYYMMEQMARMIQIDKQSQASKRRRFVKARNAVKNLVK